MVLIGEVSMVNDDANDNRFYDKSGRFPEITEDENRSISWLMIMRNIFNLNFKFKNINMSGKIIVSGVGCCLVDLLYNDIDFSSDTVHPFLSKKRGDGGLTPGHLVFQEEFEQFSESPFDRVLNKITGGRPYDKINIGGPSIVSLINAAQLIDKENCEVRFYGRGGNDEIGST